MLNKYLNCVCACRQTRQKIIIIIIMNVWGCCCGRTPYVNATHFTHSTMLNANHSFAACIALCPWCNWSVPGTIRTVSFMPKECLTINKYIALRTHLSGAPTNKKNTSLGALNRVRFIYTFSILLNGRRYTSMCCVCLCITLHWYVCFRRGKCK